MAKYEQITLYEHAFNIFSHCFSNVKFYGKLVLKNSWHPSATELRKK